MGACYAEKLVNLVFDSPIQKISTQYTLPLWFLAEIPRVYIGYVGNLHERVSELLGFIFLSVFPQFPLVIYMAFFQEHVFPTDRIMGTVMCGIMVFEVFAAFRTLNSIVRLKTTRFYRLCQQESELRDNGTTNTS